MHRLANLHSRIYLRGLTWMVRHARDSFLRIKGKRRKTRTRIIRTLFYPEFILERVRGLGIIYVIYADLASARNKVQADLINSSSISDNTLRCISRSLILEMKFQSGVETFFDIFFFFFIFFLSRD